MVCTRKKRPHKCESKRPRRRGISQLRNRDVAHWFAYILDLFERLLVLQPDLALLVVPATPRRVVVGHSFERQVSEEKCEVQPEPLLVRHRCGLDCAFAAIEVQQQPPLLVDAPISMACRHAECPADPFNSLIH